MRMTPDLEAVDRQMARDDGGPAFPSLHAYPQGGMSLRDYFAGQALALLQDRENVTSINRTRGDRSGAEAVAMIAYQMADAMLKERKR